MTDDALLTRVRALLHNPPDLALVLGEGARKDALDARARDLQTALLGHDPGPSTPEIDKADHIASGADEYNVPPGLLTPFPDHPVVRHPLADVEIPLFPDGPWDPDDSLAALSHEIAALRDAYGDDLEHLALALWRELPERLARDKGPGYGPAWSALPAQTQVPDHDVWEHLALTAALATARIGTADPASSQAGLLLVSFGPVKELIQSSRKTLDLFAGSALLSHLAWEAIRPVAEACGPEAVLFPDLRTQPLVDRWLRRDKGLQGFDYQPDFGSATLPNRFFAVVPLDDADTLAEQAVANIQTYLKALGRDAIEQVASRVGSPWTIDVDRWADQLADYVSTYWVAVPLHRVAPDPTVDAGATPGPFTAAFHAAYPGLLAWDDADADRILDVFHRHGRHANVGAAYGRLFRATDALLGARKSLREFEAAGPDGGHRCSLFPGLPAVVPEGDPSPEDVKKFWTDVDTALPHRLVSGGERLSAVALAKRVFVDHLAKTAPDLFESPAVRSPDAAFPSTSSIAAADFKAAVLSHLDDAPLAQALSAFKGAIDRVQAVDGMPSLDEAAVPSLAALAETSPTDSAGWWVRLGGRWLFSEGYTADAVLREQEVDVPEPLLGRARAALAALVGAARDLGIAPPSRYYAVLALDGDHMGRWLSGELAPPFHAALHPDLRDALRLGITPADLRAGRPAPVPLPDWHAGWTDLLDGDIRRPQAPSQHLAISRALGTFALDLVTRAVEGDHHARLVYSGGDDVLALVSLDHALPVARTLRAAFSGHVAVVDGRLVPDPSRTTGTVTLDGHTRRVMGPAATASAGIAVVHHRQPLATAIAEALRAEGDHAKTALGRDALAIHVLKRSGEAIEAGTSWTARPGFQGPDLVLALERYARLVEHGLVAAGLVYALDRERPALEGFEIARDAPWRRDAEAARADGRPPPPRPVGSTPEVRAETRRLFGRQSEIPASLPSTPDLDWLRDALPDDAPPAERRAAAEHAAFEATVGLLLDHSPVARAVALLDNAQFIGLRGRR